MPHAISRALEPRGWLALLYQIILDPQLPGFAPPAGTPSQIKKKKKKIKIKRSLITPFNRTALLPRLATPPTREDTLARNFADSPR
ncbi:hypothetical protein PUN28_005193 [Cardiocondyla obscurior]|uniref:Uncharacterized protein n=1 Tax=Cardiocondyla obscurior TaxID=286306 RepID=A0AAW2GHQ0_9HYME